MKLEFESNAVSSPLVNNQVPAEFDAEHVSPEVLQILRDGIKAAQDGDKAEARSLLLRVTEADPKNENAWLWLASISEYPEELLVFLNNVLDVNPDNERALEWAKATKSLIAKTFVQRGIEASKDDQKQFAKQCFLQAIVHDSGSELAWLWLASVTDSSEEKTSHLQKVLSINPENENALSSLKNAKRSGAIGRLPEANASAISGDRETAKQILAAILSDAPDFEDAWMLQAHLSESFEDKIAAFEKVLEINPENPVARANVDSLKIFAEENAEENAEDNEASMPDAEFDDAQPEKDIRFDAGNGPDPVTEAYNSMDPGNLDVEYHEEELVDFEGADTAAEAHSEEMESNVMQLFEDEELFKLAESVGESLEQTAENAMEDPVDSAESEEESDSAAFSAEHEAAEPEVDHDYAAEHVDGSGEEAGEQSVEFSEDNADFTPEEISQFEAESELEAADSEQVEAHSDSKDSEDDDELEALFESGDEDASAEANFESLDSASSEEEETSEDAVESDVKAMDSEETDAGDEDVQEMESAPDAAVDDASHEVNSELKRDSFSSSKSCPFCEESNEHQAFACHNCKAIFTISDIEMILSHKKANVSLIAMSLQKMESNKTLRGVDVEKLKQLGIGYLNVRDFRKGFEYLQEAVKKDPNDVVLVSQIDALAVRLAEVEEHDRVQEPITNGKRILIVDDSPTVRKLISGKLEKCGHEAICAVDGMDALAKINEVIPDLILLDITMPRMDGYQVCKLIRGNDATKDVPVVMISGKDGFFDKVRGRMAGTSNYITKPFGPETLMKTINEYIQED